MLDFYPGLARFDLQGVEKHMARLARRFDGIFEKVIDQRLRMEKEGAKKSIDVLTFLLKMKDEGGDSKTPFTMTHVKALLMVSIYVLLVLTSLEHYSFFLSLFVYYS